MSALTQSNYVSLRYFSNVRISIKWIVKLSRGVNDNDADMKLQKLKGYIYEFTKFSSVTKFRKLNSK